jgi:DNA-directed RNA polymerase specialized sigma subunit
MGRKQIKKLIQSYHWKLNVILCDEEELKGYGNNVTAQYGIQSTMPKPQGVVGETVYMEVQRRADSLDNIRELQKDVECVNALRKCIIDPRQKYVLDCILEGRSLREISALLRTSHSSVMTIRDTIVNDMYNYLPNLPNLPNCEGLREEKVSC